MTTIVTGFLKNVNTNKRKIDTYMEHGKQLLSLFCNKIMFVEQDVYDTYLKDEFFPTTHFVIVKRKDNYLYEYMDHLTDPVFYTDNYGKDTMEYMMLICHKTEWVKKAIENNFFHSDQFVWIDFGIRHVLSSCQVIDAVLTKTYDCVRIAAGKTSLDSAIPISILHRVHWYFLGGIFGGNASSLCEFADKMKTLCIDIIKKNNILCWEVNIWFILYKMYPTLFSPYYSDHNNSMIVLY